MRRTEILYNGEWVEIPFDHLNAGDIFRLYEEDGTIVSNNIDNTNCDTWRATSDARLKDGSTYTVDCEPFE